MRADQARSAAEYLHEFIVMCNKSAQHTPPFGANIMSNCTDAKRGLMYVKRFCAWIALIFMLVASVSPVALRMVWQVHEAVRIPIVGCGGVSCAQQAVEMLLAGATAVEVGAANLVDPWACEKIVDRLPGVMEQYGISDWQKRIGGAHTWQRT